MTQIANVDVLIAGRRMPLVRVTLECADPSLTKQSFSKDSDIRNILAKYAKTGILGDQNRKPIFGDFTNTEYQTSLDLVANVNSSFEKLPVSIRDRFNNSPLDLIDFMADETNTDESVQLGLREHKQKPIAELVPAIPPTAEKPVPITAQKIT